MDPRACWRVSNNCEQIGNSRVCYETMKFSNLRNFVFEWAVFVVWMTFECWLPCGTKLWSIQFCLFVYLWFFLLFFSVNSSLKASNLTNWKLFLPFGSIAGFENHPDLDGNALVVNLCTENTLIAFNLSADFDLTIIHQKVNTLKWKIDWFSSGKKRWKTSSDWQPVLQWCLKHPDVNNEAAAKMVMETRKSAVATGIWLCVQFCARELSEGAKITWDLLPRRMKATCSQRWSNNHLNNEKNV